MMASSNARAALCISSEHTAVSLRPWPQVWQAELVDSSAKQGVQQTFSIKMPFEAGC